MQINRRYLKKRILTVNPSFFIILIISIFMTGCSTMIISIEADKDINDGILLPVDIISVNESFAGKVSDIGPQDWFGHYYREKLSPDELNTLAIAGGQNRRVKVKIHSGVERIIVYTDFENIDDRDSQQVILMSSRFRRYKFIRIRGNGLELKK